MLTYISQTVSSNLQVPSIQVTMAICVGLYVLYRKSESWNRKLPPGPMALPVIGNLLQLAQNDHTYELFHEWGKQYGDVFMVKMGNKPAVILNSFKAIREALITKQNDFAGRPRTYSMDLFTYDGKDIAFGDFGHIWQVQRKLAHKAFRKFASGDHLEVLVSAAVDRLFDKLDTAATKGDSVRPLDKFTEFTCDIQHVMCFGLEVFDKEDPVYIKIRDGFDEFTEKLGKGLMADYIPWFRFVYKIYKTKAFREIIKFMDTFEDYIKRHMDEKRKNFDEDNIQDIMSMMIAVQKEFDADPSESWISQFTDTHFVMVIRDIFGAGTDTSRFTLDWFVQLMALHPNIQDKLYQEIESNVGKDSRITLDDRPKLPYVEATLYEVLRYRTIVPLSLPHTTTCDTSCMGYDIPAGTLVFPSLYACHMDPEYWPEPDQFKPERFLNADGSASSVRPAFLPFSTGRRVCIGETLVKSTLNYTMASLIQRYEFSLVPGETPNLDSIYCFMMNAAKPYKVIAKLRQ